ncbi:MAG: cytochrome c biogenesis protein CcsA [Bacteroidetes bacterium]|nr:cytochrome c biogenesis protein CcsA [Bacteroidota bacterium]
MLGKFLINFTFTLSLLSTIFYWYSFIRKSEFTYQKFARYLFYYSVIGIVISSTLLIYYILTHQFQYHYIWGHSSTDLPISLLVSTFYAGQEGSFNLWALLTGLLGIFLIKYNAKRNYEIEFMSVYGLIFTILILFLVIKNPFTLIWDVFPKELIQYGGNPNSSQKYTWIDQAKGIWASIPVEGRGLNPLLQNYWMVIHPPILFIGFTSMSVPFAFAVASLLKKDYLNWINIAKPWVIFGSMVLGCGILLGGFWAYETLGWGGFWGWDPVENSSLVPWLVSIATLHTMLTQKNSNKLIRTNFIFSILTFLLVLYSTFLTRSGVLGDTSVHSFVTPGATIYWLLLGAIILFSGLSIYMLILRWKEIPKEESNYSVLSREYALFLGASTLVISSFFIAIGTSSPLITLMLKGKASAVEINYYIQTNLPLAIALALFSGLGQLLWWKNTPIKILINKIWIPFIVSFALTTISYFVGVKEVTMLILIFSSYFMLIVNLMLAWNVFKGKISLVGSYVTHVGFALMLLGFVFSAKYDSKQTLSLEEGKTISAFNFDFTYLGYQQKDKNRYAFNILIDDGKDNFFISPIMFINNQDNSVIRHPDIKNLYTKDLYISPLSLDEGKSQGEELNLIKNKIIETKGITLKYLGYDFVQLKGGINDLTLSIEYKNSNKIQILKPKMINKKGNLNFQSAKTDDNKFEISIISVNPSKIEDQTTAKILLTKLDGAQNPKKETLIVEATIKPLIILVWIGTAIVMIGFIITLIRRVKEAK